MVLSDKAAYDFLQKIMKLYPQAQPQLIYENAFQLVVALILSARTSDQALAKITPTLFTRYPTPADLAQSKPTEIEAYINQIGLYHQKAKYLYQTGQILVDQFEGQVPATRDDLMKLAGIGRKSANLVLSKAFNIPAFAVDSHIQRIAYHHSLVSPGASLLKIENRVCQLLEADQWGHAHQAMIEFGRHHCRPGGRGDCLTCFK